ncbi:MAG: hypothetical protein JO340_03145 [Acidobacteriaceae bacterium]|nr:hypothetical protein [Acidobacteriaceae bacterium]
MRSLAATALGFVLAASASFAQSAFTVTGTQIPQSLLQQNYGTVPKGVTAYDLNICNSSSTKQTLVSSEIYQALSNANVAIQPIGREIMLAAILRNQSHSPSSLLKVSLNSATAVLSILSSSKYHIPSGWITGAALASISGQQVLSDLSPILSADQLEKFESQTLEAALALDGGSCAERTVFALSVTSKTKSQELSFHVR